jgi:hypothetical protein
MRVPPLPAAPGTVSCPTGKGPGEPTYVSVRVGKCVPTGGAAGLGLWGVGDVGHQGLGG